MLTIEDKELADKVNKAYRDLDDGKLYRWVGKSAIRDRMKYPEWSTSYIKSMHSIVLAVICAMVVKEVLTLNE